MKRISILIATLGLHLALLSCPARAESAEKDIKLVVQITVDGLRADLLNRYRAAFGEGGFRHLQENGAVYTNAHYQHANTETIVGHTTLATGAYPSVHGMIGNVWFDRESAELAYNIEDPDHPPLFTREITTPGAQIDPAQRAARTQGRSPAAILAPTLSDGLAAYHAGQSRIFGVSGKDRGAVSMAGHAGKAFWFSVDTGDFVTSTYYYDAYPDWVKKWNDQRKANDHAGKEWALSGERSTYLLAGQDDRPYEADLKGYGRVFPHPFGELSDALYYTRILVSPVGDALVLDFAKALVNAEKLGQDAIPDYLSLSFSSVDAVNHFFGPSSLENEEVVRVLDRTLADLFSFLDGKIGLPHTLIVLSADHGMAEMPEYMAEFGVDAKRLDPKKIVAVANKAGEELGVDEVVRFFFRPYLYLNDEKIREAGLDNTRVQKTVADALTHTDGIALAAPSALLASLEGSSLLPPIRKNFHASRSGDIYVVQKPYWFVFESGPIATMHGSPWRYDTHVPIIFAGPGIRPGSYSRLVHPADVAPTVAACLGMSPPAAAQGAPLREVVDMR